MVHDAPMIKHLLTPLLALAFTGCIFDDILPSITLGGAEGIPPVSGSTTIAVPQGFACGAAITDPAGNYTITTSGTAEACAFTFSKTVTALTSASYANNPALKGARFIESVDFAVSALGVKDGTTGAALSVGTTLLDLDAKALGTTILTEADLTKTPPFKVSVTGAPVDALKSAVAAKQDVVLPISVVATVKLTPTPPGSIGLTLEAQPSLVIGF